MATTEVRKRQVMNMSRIIMVVFTLFVLFIPQADAAWYENGLQVAMTKQIFGGVTNTLVTCMNSPVYGVVTADAFTTGEIAGFYNAIKIIGAMWIIILALSRMFTNIEREEDKMQCIFKAILEIGVASLIIMYLGEIINGILLMGQSIINHAAASMPGGGAGMTDAEAEAILKTLTGQEKGGFSWKVYSLAILVFPWICSLLIGIATQFLMYQLFLEIGIRRAFAPIAVADIYHEGLRSPGVRYFKRILAVFLKIAMCYLTAWLCGKFTIASSPTGILDSLTYIFEVIAINFTSIGFMMKSGEIANDVVGA